MAKTDFSMGWLKCTTVSATTAYQDISQNLIEINGWETEGVLEETHGLGDAWVENSFVGLKRTNEITLTMFYDDDGTSGSKTIFGNASDIGAERSIKLNVGTTNAYLKTDVIVRSFSRQPKRGELTKCQVALMPTGAATVVTT